MRKCCSGTIPNAYGLLTNNQGDSLFIPVLKYCCNDKFTEYPLKPQRNIWSTPTLRTNRSDLPLRKRRDDRQIISFRKHGDNDMFWPTVWEWDLDSGVMGDRQYHSRKIKWLGIRVPGLPSCLKWDWLRVLSVRMEWSLPLHMFLNDSVCRELSC